MIKKKYSTSEELLGVALESLMNNEVENMLMISLLKRLKGNEFLFGSEPTLYFSVEVNGELGFAMQTPPHNLIVSFPCSSLVLDELVNYLFEKKLQFPGVTTEFDLARQFSKKWCELTGNRESIFKEERGFCLKKVNPETLGDPNWGFRVANKSDIEQILEWMWRFLIDCDVDQKPETYEEFYRWQKPFIKDTLKTFYFLEVEGERVTMARIPADTPNGTVLNYVYTPDNQRKKGYGSAIVSRLSQHVLDSGKSMSLLFTDLANPTSNKIYQKIGYEKVFDMTMFKFSKD